MKENLTTEDINEILKEEKRNKTEFFFATKRDIKKILKQYHCEEYSIHFYDSSPPECEECDSYKICENCPIMNEYYQEKKNIHNVTWVDTFGVDIWDEMQEDIDQEVEGWFEEIFKTKIKSRLFIFEYEYDNKKYIGVYFYARDKRKFAYADYYFGFPIKVK